MNAKIFGIFAILLLLNAGIAFGGPQSYWLLSYQPRGCFDIPKIIENQVLPMSKTFGFDIDTSAFSSQATNQLIVNLNLALPQFGLERIDYSIVRDGVELNEAETTVEVGDIIRYEVQGELGEQGNDWVAQGGSVDSPPIQMLTTEQYKALYQQLEQKFKTKYPWNNMTVDWPRVEFVQEQTPVFQTEKTKFNPATVEYTAENGYQAYVVPILNGKKAGIQVFCAISISGQYAAADCEQPEAGTIECTAKQAGILPVDVSAITDCMSFVDKVIIGNEAVQADWFYGHPIIPTYSLSQFGLFPPSQIQIIPKGKKPPIADFKCKKTEKKYPASYGGYTYTELECDASDSKAQEGTTIERYAWNYLGFGSDNIEDVIHTYCASTYSSYFNQFCQKTVQVPTYALSQSSLGIILRVTDNQGIYGERIRIIDPNNPNPQPKTEFTAFYENQKVLLKLENCPEGITQSNANIYLLGADGEPENAVLEKQPIQCEQTTEISGITAPGLYVATATLGKDQTITSSPFGPG
ncbi:MAG: hypothetical protein NT067_06420 [Candidatus Diapherotrites archaeon]|nr:hypothetical protein [Candidatus Diapherotrites archaeon]